MKILFFFLCVFLFICSCREGRGDIGKWEGKEILFPHDMAFTRLATDTITYHWADAEYKILVYVDSVGCTDCKLQLYKWKDFMEEVDSLARKEVSFLFVFQPKELFQMKYMLRAYEFDHPIYMDLENKLDALNHFPEDTISQTYLLDKDNVVIASGNPVYDVTSKDLYLRVLTGMGTQQSEDRGLKTNAQVEQQVFDLGEMSRFETKEIIVRLHNVGKNLLVVENVNTTCGCTDVSYDKQPIKPGACLEVRVAMSAQDEGFFNKAIYIQYNSVDNQKIKVNIKGIVH